MPQKGNFLPLMSVPLPTVRLPVDDFETLVILRDFASMQFLINHMETILFGSVLTNTLY